MNQDEELDMEINKEFDELIHQVEKIKQDSFARNYMLYRLKDKIENIITYLDEDNQLEDISELAEQ